MRRVARLPGPGVVEDSGGVAARDCLGVMAWGGVGVVVVCLVAPERLVAGCEAGTMRCSELALGSRLATDKDAESVAADIATAQDYSVRSGLAAIDAVLLGMIDS